MINELLSIYSFLRIHLRASESSGRGLSTPGWGTRPTRRRRTRRTSATRTGTMAVSTRGRRTTRLVTYCVYRILWFLLVYLLWRGILHIMYVSMLQRHSPWGIMYRHQRKGRIPASRRIRILVRKVYRVRSPEQNRFVWSSSVWPARGKLLLSRGDIFFLSDIFQTTRRDTCGLEKPHLLEKMSLKTLTENFTTKL